MDFIILSLAIWRISNLFIEESGPYAILELFRHQLGIRYNEQNVTYATNELAELFTCMWCLSIHIGIILTILYWFYPTIVVLIVMPFSLSSIAILINKFIKY